MSRLIVHLLPLILPFLLYGLYIWHVKRSGKDGPEATPWFWLAAIGMVLMILSFVVYGAFFGETLGDYAPARFEDGRIVPGRISQ
jgi:heme A synthase